MTILMIDTILSVAGRLFALKEALSKARRERRDRIANYFDAISDTLAAVHTSLKTGEMPHGKCAEMRQYALRLPETIGDQIEQGEAQDLSRQLYSAYDVERLLWDLENSPERDTELARLDEASGVFAAIANSIRAAP